MKALVPTLLFLSGMFLSVATQAFEPPPLTGPVVDQAQIIDPSDRAYLEKQIRLLKEHSGIQAQVLTLSSLGGESIEQVGIDTAEKWKLGTAKEDNGIILIVAPNEKKMRIEVGQGLEGVIPDILAYQIIQRKMVPAFRSNLYGKGLIAAIATIESLAAPETAKAARKNLGARKKSPFGGSSFILILIVVLLVFGGIFPGGRGGRRSGRAFLLGMLLGHASGRRGGFGGGGFGGGGGWSGGGGGFSGGGASGGW